MRKFTVVLFLCCGAFGLFMSRTVQSEDVQPPKTIMILPANCNLTFEDSLTVLFERDAIRNYSRSRISKPTRSLSVTEERDFWNEHSNDFANDAAFINLLDDYDRAISRHRGERGRAYKAYHASHIARTIETLNSHQIEIQSYDLLSGIIFLDGNRYSESQIQALLPGEIVELQSEVDILGDLSNAETRVKWLHDRGISGSDYDDPDTLGFDYLNVDHGIDTTVTDIVGGHRFFGNLDTTFIDPFIGGLSTQHGMLTCGIVTSDNDTTRGVAYELDSIFVSNARQLIGMHWTSTGQTVRGYSWGFADTDSQFGDSPEVSNCAIGSPGPAGYDGFARFFDSLVDEFDVFLSISAGNMPYTNPLGVCNSGNSYNPIVVNGIDMKSDSLRVNDTLAGNPTQETYGGWGPAMDGRKKPDMCVPVKSMSLRNWDNSIYVALTPATSWASPQIAGAGLLLMTRGVTNQRSIKALMLNTTFRPESMTAAVWDTGYGWGMLDADHAIVHADLGDYFENTVSSSGLGGDKVYYRGSFLPFDSVNNTYDRATIAWEIHANWSYGDTNITAKPLTNIDLFLFDGSDMSLVSSSTSTIDNVEQVYWNSTTDTLSNAILIVDCEGSLPSGYSYEPFSLATEENFSYYSGPRSMIGLKVENESMELAVLGHNYIVDFRVFLDGDAECDTIWPSLSPDAYTSIVSGPNPSYLVMAQGDTNTVSYTLNSSTTGRRTITSSVGATCYRTSWNESVNKTYQVVNEIPGGGPAHDDPESKVVEFSITRVAYEPGRTLLHCVAPGPMDVRMDVFDLRGRRITSVTKSISISDVIEWGHLNKSGARVASGVYFLQVAGGGKVFTKKVVVVR